MIKEEILQNFGLTKSEVNLYITLLTIGEATASELAKKTNTNRTFTYDRLKKLLDFGIISYVIKDNKKYFKAAEPSQLLSILKEKEEQIKKILPELEKLRIVPKLATDIKIFTSKKGVSTALNLILKDKKPVNVYGSIARFKQVMESFYEIWNSRRIKEKIHLKILTNEEIKMNFAQIDLLPEEEKSSITTFTFGNKMIIVLWADIPVAIYIQSSEIAKDYISFFNAIWNREVKIYSGVNGIQRAFMELLEVTKEFIGFGYSKQLSDVYTVEFSDNWHIERIKKKVICRIIAFEEKETKAYFKPRIKAKKDFYVRFLNKELQGPACISLSDKMIATFVYTEKRFRVIVNKNKETITAYKKYFEELWKKATN